MTVSEIYWDTRQGKTFAFNVRRGDVIEIVRAHTREDAERLREEIVSRCPACNGTGGGQYNDCGYCDGNGVIG